jgi:hypothetical protein
VKPKDKNTEPVVVSWDASESDDTILMTSAPEDNRDCDNWGDVSVSDFKTLAEFAGKYPWLIRLECHALGD